MAINLARNIGGPMATEEGGLRSPSAEVAPENPAWWRHADHCSEATINRRQVQAARPSATQACEGLADLRMQVGAATACTKANPHEWPLEAREPRRTPQCPTRSPIIFECWRSSPVIPDWVCKRLSTCRAGATPATTAPRQRNKTVQPNSRCAMCNAHGRGGGATAGCGAL